MSVIVESNPKKFQEIPMLHFLSFFSGFGGPKFHYFTTPRFLHRHFCSPRRNTISVFGNRRASPWNWALCVATAVPAPSPKRFANGLWAQAMEDSNCRRCCGPSVASCRSGGKVLCGAGGVFQQMQQQKIMERIQERISHDPPPKHWQRVIFTPPKTSMDPQNRCLSMYLQGDIFRFHAWNSKQVLFNGCSVTSQKHTFSLKDLVKIIQLIETTIYSNGWLFQVLWKLENHPLLSIESTWARFQAVLREMRLMWYMSR